MTCRGYYPYRYTNWIYNELQQSRPIRRGLAEGTTAIRLSSEQNKIQQSCTAHLPTYVLPYKWGIRSPARKLRLVLNCVVLWNTFYMNAALDKLRASGYEVRDEDVARLWPFVSRHLNKQGHYFFFLPE